MGRPNSALSLACRLLPFTILVAGAVLAWGNADPLREPSLALGVFPHLQLTPMALEQADLPVLPTLLQAGDDLDFDLLGQSKPKEISPAQLALEHQEKVRRSMLTFHQGIGLATLGLLAVTDTVGQLNYLDHFAGSNSARWERAHEILAFTTLTTFAITGLVGLLAPVPAEKPRDIDTTLLHKIMMAGATLGMATEMGLGIYTEGHEGFANQKTLAQVHQYIGFSTLGLMTLGVGAFIL